MVKMMIVGRRRGGMTVAQHHRYMKHEHGQSVVNFIAEQPEMAPRRYVQNHVFDGSFRVPGATPDHFAVSRDFVTQVWFDSPAQAAAATQAPFYREQLQPDEDRFVDQASVAKLPVLEHHRMGDRCTVGHHKLFVFHQAVQGVSPDALAEVTLKLWQPLFADGNNGIEQVVQNRVLNRPAQSATVDVVDEVWLSGEDATRKICERWHALATEDKNLSPLLVPGSAFVLMAHEHVMFAGAAVA